VRLDDLTRTFGRSSGPIVHAVNGVSLAVHSGETFALIGESGSGKSTVGRLALRLLEPDSGVVYFDDVDLAKLDRRALRRMRARMTIVFQEPYESLNPRQTIGKTIAEPLLIHAPGLTPLERQKRVLDTLDHVALNASLADRYPHELSGGQQQRVGIARAIVTRPQFIVLDEPTSSLDLSVRAQILELLADLQDEYNLAYLFITHDIHTVEYVSDRIAVIYLGQIVETGRTDAVFGDPRHPYTQALLSSTLSADPEVRKERFVLGGEIPSATNLPLGCFLYGRCPIGTPECASAPVPLHAYAMDHQVACIKVPWLSGSKTEQSPTGRDSAASVTL
jgi:oligopeptide/dipeptide ABC transporter ATP-binding protein